MKTDSSRTCCAVILAAGEGTRMHSRTTKLLEPLCGKPLLCYPLRAVRQAGIRHVCVVVGHQKREIKQTFSKESVQWAVQQHLRGTGDALASAWPKLRGFEGTLLVVSGDSPLVRASTIQVLLAHHRSRKASCTMLTARLKDPAGYGRILRDEKGKFLGILEEKDASRNELGISEVNSGLYAFRAPEVFEHLGRLDRNNAKREFYLTDVTTLLVEAGLPVETHLAADPTEALGVNSRWDLAQAEAILRERAMLDWMSQGVTIVAPELTYIDPDVEIGPDTIIYPFTVIEHTVKIGSGCHAGPFAHLRPGTVLADRAEVGNFTELKKTFLGHSSKAKHLSYLGDSRIGRGVIVGAGTITANYDGREKHRTVVEDGVSLGSGTVLVAPVRVGRNAVTGAGAIVTKRHNVRPGDVVVGIPARSLSDRVGAKALQRSRVARARRARKTRNGTKR